MARLAILATHPIQYHAPWFRYLVREAGLELRVFYLWDFGVTEQADASGFQRTFKWDVPLLDGYEYEFVANRSSHPGTGGFWGLRNPGLLETVAGFNPDAVLLLGYNFASLMHFLWRWDGKIAPMFLRGDSHRLVPRSGIVEWLRRGVISSVFRRFRGFLYVGRANYEYFRMHGAAPAELFFAPHAIDNARFSQSTDAARTEASGWKRDLGIPAADKVVLFAGKFEPKKRPLDLLAAFKRQRLKGVTLLFVGSGPLEPEMRALAEGDEAVRFAPFQNQSLMPRTYAAGDLFVLPSAGSGETWGLAVNEAMCLSLPIIASSHVGCAADLVRHNENGLVFPAGDVAALARCINDALSDDRRLSEWGKASRRIIAGYSYAQATEGLLLAMKSVGIDPQDLRR